MSPLYLVGLAVTLVAAVRAVARGQAWPWLLVILMFPPLGAIAYLVSDWLGSGGGVRFRARKVTAGDEAQARADVLRADSAGAWSDYASVLRARGKADEARTAAENALARDPGDVHARYELGRSLLELGRPAEAVGHLERVVAADRGHDYGDCLLALAKAREAAGDAAGALAAYEELASASSRPDVLFHLAEYQRRVGDRDGAIATLRRLTAEAELAPKFARKAGRSYTRRARRALAELGAR